MNPVAAQQVALDNALVAPEKRLKIEKCNARIEFSKPQREDTFQVTLDALKLSPCYPAFLITIEVPEVYTHQFLNTIKKIKDIDAYRFKLDKKKFRIDIEVFHEILDICPRLPNQDFIICTSPREHLMLSSIGASLESHQDLIGLAVKSSNLVGDISTARKENMPYPRFTKVIISYFISKDKTISMRNMINLHTVRDDSLLATGKATPKKEKKFKKVASPSKKLSHVLEEEPAKKPKQAKKPSKKCTTVQTSGVVIGDTLGVSVSKKKAPDKVDRGKGMDLLSDVALLEATQLKKALKKSKQETQKLHASGLGVFDIPKYQSESENESWGYSEDDDSNDDDSDDVTNDGDDDVDSDTDGDNEASDSERTDSDEDENPNLNQNDDKEEEYEEEYVRTLDNYEFSDDDEEYKELYKDVNVRLKDVEHEEEGKGDAEMTDAGHDGVSQEKSYEQVEDDAHVTLTVAHVTHKTEVVSMMNVKVRHEEPSTRTPSFLTIPVTVIPETSTAAAPTIPPTTPPITPLTQQSKPTPTPAPTTETTTTIILALPDLSSLFGFDQRVSILKKELSQLKQVYYSTQLLETIKSQIPTMRGREDKDKDEDPHAGSDQRLKRRKTRKDAEPSKGSKSKKSKSSSSKGTKSQPKSSGKSTQAEELVFEVADTEMPQNQGSDLGNTDDQPNVEASSKHDCRIAQAENPPLTFDELMSTPIDFSAYVMNNLKIDNLTQEHLVGPAFNILKGICRSQVELEYHFEECYKAVTDRLDWNNPDGQEYPFDLSKPLPFIEDRGHQVVHVGYFINNDLEYLKGGSSSRKHTNSTTKTKAAKYNDIQGIEDMVPSLWSPVKHDVFSSKRIIAVTHAKVMKWYDYGYLEEIEVRREDQNLYKFKEGDFLRLNLRDIEDNWGCFSWFKRKSLI
ncbi:hypothetical protein Tco_1474477 [Tanacetum coccineum]